MKLIQVLPVKQEVIYLNVDKILYVSPIGETGKSIIMCVNNEHIKVDEPLFKVLDKIKKAND
jgi:hypothetical protein